MRRALEEYRIVGVRTNIPFHQTMMSTYPFITGKYDTRFVEEQFSMIDAAENRELYLDIAALMASLVAHGQMERRTQIYPHSEQKSNWKWAGRREKLQPMKYIAEVDGLEFPVEILDEHHVRFGENVLEVDLAAVSGEPLYSLIVNGESFEGYVYPDEAGWQVLLLGQFYQVRRGR